MASEAPTPPRLESRLPNIAVQPLDENQRYLLLRFELPNGSNGISDIGTKILIAATEIIEEKGGRIINSNTIHPQDLTETQADA